MLKKFTGCLREVSKEFPGSFKGFSRKIRGVFRESSKGDSKELREHLNKLKGCFKGV